MAIPPWSKLSVIPAATKMKFLANVGPVPEAASLEQVGLGWANKFGSGKADDAITSGIEVIWTKTPTKWDSSGFLKSLWHNDWTLTKSPAGAWQFEAKNGTLDYPDPFDKTKFRHATMLVTDITLREDPVYANITRRWLENPKELEETFAKAWFKLLHRDMGPKTRYLGPEVPKEDFIWQDPLPTPPVNKITDDDVATLKKQILDAGIDTGKLVATAWSSADTYRHSDKRGGANGARIALEPQNSWPINAQAGPVIKSLSAVRDAFNKANADRQVSLADMIVLGGVAAVEKAVQDAGFTSIKVPFAAGRVDALQNETDKEAMNHLRYPADGFLNYGKGTKSSRTEQILVDKAAQLTLSPPELAAAVGGLRALGATFDGSKTGVLTSKAGTLTNDYFVNLLSMANVWTAADDAAETFTAKDRKTGEERFTATRADLVFASHAELRAIAEVYASVDGQERFAKDFVAVFNKVMNLDRYDLA